MDILDLIKTWKQFVLELSNYGSFSMIRNLAMTCKDINQNVKEQFNIYRVLCENYVEYGYYTNNQQYTRVISNKHICVFDDKNNEGNYVLYKSNPLFLQTEQLYTNDYEEKLFYKIFDCYRNKVSIEFAAKNDCYPILNWYYQKYKKENALVVQPTDLYDYLSSEGNIKMLTWFKNHRSVFLLYCSENAVDYASLNGYIDILDFWYEFDRAKFKYTPYAIDWASKYGHIHILEWFFKKAEEFITNLMENKFSIWESPIEFKFLYTNRAIGGAAINNNISVLNWFYDHAHSEYIKTITNSSYIPLVEFIYPYYAIDLAASYGYVDVLEWFFLHSTYVNKGPFAIDFRYTNRAFDMATTNNHISVLNWFLEKHIKYDLQLEVSDTIFNYMLTPETKNWWINFNNA